MYRIAVRYKLSFPFLYLVIESNYRPLHVKQIRYHYANEAIRVFVLLKPIPGFL